jgi:hypothetical protein
MTHKRRIFFFKSCFEVLDGLFCHFDVLYGGLGLGKLQFDFKKIEFFSALIFFQFLVIKAPNPDWYSALNAGSGSG